MAADPHDARKHAAHAYERVIAALETRGSSRRGRDWQCPAHEDRTPSLTVNEGANGGVVMHCHAGCTFDEILAALGLSSDDIFEANGNGQAAILATYPYHDEHGTLLYQVVRKEGKKFLQRRPDGNGGWIWRLEDTRRVLYRLPKVLDAIKRGETIYVVEGEKDVHAIEHAGATATCNPGGAAKPGQKTKWRTEYSESLRGANVVVVADRDEPGRAHAAAIADSLKGIASSARIVEPIEGKDASDHLRAGHGLDELKAPNAPPTPQVAEILRVLLEEAQDTRDADGPARQEIPGTAGFGYRGVPTVFFSERGHGKSTIVIVLNLCAAANGEKVLYLDRENGAALTKSKINDILTAHDQWGDPLADGRFVGRHYPEIRASWTAEAYGEAIASAGFTIVTYDSWREFLTVLGLDPNSDQDISTFINLAVTPLVKRGLWVSLLDNVGHEHTDRPKNSGAKLDAIPQAYKVLTTSKFTAIEVGALKVTCTRSRYGDMDREWTMRVGGGFFDLPRAASEAPDAKRARQAAEGLEKFRKACITALQRESPLGRDKLIAAVKEKGIKGRTETLRGWLAQLAADRASGIEQGSDGYRVAMAPEDGAGSGPPPSADPPGPLAPALTGGQGPGQGGPGPTGHPGIDPDCFADWKPYRPTNGADDDDERKDLA